MAAFFPKAPTYPVPINSAELTTRVLPSLQRAVGMEQVMQNVLPTAAEDFAYFAQEVPGFYFLLGGPPLSEE